MFQLTIIPTLYIPLTNFQQREPIYTMLGWHKQFPKRTKQCRKAYLMVKLSLIQLKASQLSSIMP